MGGRRWSCASLGRTRRRGGGTIAAPAGPAAWQPFDESAAGPSMSRRGRNIDAPLRILVADDSPDAIAQMTAWIGERWPSAQVFTANTPDDAVRMAAEQRIENLVLDLDFGAHRESGAAVARKILDARFTGERITSRIVFRTVHAGDPGYLHQVQKLMVREDRRGPAVWGFLDKGSVPKRLVQNTIEQVFVYGVSFTDMFAQQLKNSPSRDLSDLEFTVLIYLCLGVTNDGVGWLLSTSRQSVERILSGLYRKLRIPSRRGAPQAVPTLLESRTRLCCEAMIRGLVNPHLLREEDAELNQFVKSRAPQAARLFVNPEWLDVEPSGTRRGHDGS
jgi:DNA-binding NarL/FixJ family response regulator